MAPEQLADAESQKRAAGRQAAEMVQNGQRLGLGTGSTVRYFVEALGERVAAGLRVSGVATSVETANQARKLGIELLDLNDLLRDPLTETGDPGARVLDLAVDGADEIDPALNLIKGLGGALVREKLVEIEARQLVIVGDEGKLVSVLGSRAPVPVAVVPFGWKATLGRLAAIGCRPVARRRGSELILTDDGLLVIDCWFGPLPDPAAIERAILLTAGVVSTGLFIGMASFALVGRADGSVTRLAPVSVAPGTVG